MSSSAVVVAANEDLLTDILLRLPIKPLLRFKCVSKPWRSLINSPHFRHRKNPNNKVTGLIVLRLDMGYAIKFVYDVIPLYRTPEFPRGFISRSVQSVDRIRTEILHSCNGLLCFRFDENVEEKYDYYVCNPTTRQLRKLPTPNHVIDEENKVDSDSDSEGGLASALAMQLAFDPRKSSHYKVLCLYFGQTGDLEMEIYSSETGLWRRQMCCNQFSMHFVSLEPGRWMCIDRKYYRRGISNIKKGVYWNGAINWLNFCKGDGLYYNLDEERFGKWPMLPLCIGSEKRKINYFGGSGDHMCIVVFYDPNATNFEVYEMDKEYSGWFIRYHVDVGAVMKSPIYPEWIDDCGFDIISVVLGDREEDSVIVIGIPGLAIRYNLNDKSFEKIWNFFTRKNSGGDDDDDDDGDEDIDYCRPMYTWFDVFHGIESISSV